MAASEENSTTIEPENKNTTNEIIKIIGGSKKSESDFEAETRKKQALVLNNIPDDIVERLLGHLKANFIEQLKYNTTQVDRVVLSGEIFETLVETQDDLGLLSAEKYTSQTDRQKQIGETLLSVMANPSRYGLKINALMNPDEFDYIYKIKMMDMST